MLMHVINLDRASERLGVFRDRNQHIPDIARFSAIDGRDADKARLAAAGLIAPSLPYTDGALGNALSHIALWRRTVESGSPAMIIEDDAILSHHLLPSAEKLLATLRDDWDLVLWGWNFDAFIWLDLLPGASRAIVRLYQEDARRNSAAFQRIDVPRAAARVLHFFGTACYSVSPKGARALLDYCVPLRPLLIDFDGFGITMQNRTLDAMLNGICPRLRAFACVPPLALPENDHSRSMVVER
jgi:glycosyl transferase family 25